MSTSDSKSLQVLLMMIQSTMAITTHAPLAHVAAAMIMAGDISITTAPCVIEA